MRNCSSSGQKTAVLMSWPAKASMAPRDSQKLTVTNSARSPSVHHSSQAPGCPACPGSLRFRSAVHTPHMPQHPPPGPRRARFSRSSAENCPSISAQKQTLPLHTSKTGSRCRRPQRRHPHLPRRAQRLGSDKDPQIAGKWMIDRNVYQNDPDAQRGPDPPLDQSPTPAQPAAQAQRKYWGGPTCRPVTGWCKEVICASSRWVVKVSGWSLPSTRRRLVSTWP
jgi:hypothetical protein